MKSRRQLFLSLGAVAFVGLVVRGCPRAPDEFFSNIRINVPASAIVSHQTNWGLNSETHQIVLQVPAASWPALLAQFKAKSRFENKTPALKTNYRAFVSGREAFYPARVSLPSAGEFLANGRDGYPYICRFLRDGKTGQLWFVGWSPDN